MELRADRSLSLRRWAAAGIASLVLLLALVGATSKLWQFGVASPFTDPLDFRAFYCAGAAVKDRQNPYRLEPVRSCQRTVLAAAGLRLNEKFVLPAPLPPYSLVLFAILALLPYRLAAALWLSINLIALFVSIAVVNKLSCARPWVVALSLFISAGIVCLSLGQVVPVVLAAALFAALCARRGSGIGAAIGATIAALEPHLALPIWLGLAFFVPRARKPLAVAATALCAITLLAGPALNLEYVRTVIPLHARAELLNFEGQYGLSSLLVALGVPLQSALRAGSACYAVMLAFGLVLGAALQRRTGDAAFIVIAPLASVVFGGPFLHIQQTVVAIPLGFMLAARAPRYSLAFGAVAFSIFLLAVPWPLADMVLPPMQTSQARGAVMKVPVRLPVAKANESIEIPYAAFITAFERRPDKHSVEELAVRKMPTWFALMVLLAIASRVAFGIRRRGQLTTAQPAT